MSFASEAIDQGVSWKQGQAEAYNMRGTYKCVSRLPLGGQKLNRSVYRFLIGDSVGARDDLQKSLDLVPEFVQSWVKIASVHMELGEPACFILNRTWG